MLTVIPHFVRIQLTRCGIIIHIRKWVINLKHEKLKKFRMMKEYNQTELAKKLGIDRSYYNQIENGKVTPSMALLERIAEELGRNLKDFF